MAFSIRIPKLSDERVISGLSRIRDSFEYEKLKVVVHLRFGTEIEFNQERIKDNPQLAALSSIHSQSAYRVDLRSGDGTAALTVVRRPEEITDFVEFTDSWPNSRNGRGNFAEQYAKLQTSVRKELKVGDVEAALAGSGDDSWDRYRASQAAVLNSLQQTTEELIVRAAEKNVEIEAVRSAHFEKLEATLREELSGEREALNAEIERKNSDIQSREQLLADREAAFNTKEARYVARAKQEEQIKQVKDWLANWNLTKATEGKRRPIFLAYVAAILSTAWLTWYAFSSNYQILNSASAISQLAWWQWVAISLKSVLPFAAFTTFLIYFIRWSSAWAKQHAEEEFRNRALLIDIGRSSWLLEAVRDSQERQGEIPVDLLKELSRNLFSYSTSGDSDIHPQAISDLVLQGITSLRMKTPDGTEVEAMRSKK